MRNKHSYSSLVTHLTILRNVCLSDLYYVRSSFTNVGNVVFGMTSNLPACHDDKVEMQRSQSQEHLLQEYYDLNVSCSSVPDHELRGSAGRDGVCDREGTVSRSESGHAHRRHRRHRGSPA